jgi:DNA-binding GntR family transcriptional regulator
MPNRLDGYRTIPDVVLDRLRQEILSGVLKPEQKLDQIDLAERLGVSRLPVREALLRLEAEGLVTIHPHRGAYVAHPTLEELEEVYSIRLLLEGWAARLAAQNLSDEDMSYLEELNQRWEEATGAGDFTAMLMIDREFHTVILQAARRPRLIELIDSLWNQTQQYRRVLLSAPSRWPLYKGCHHELLAAGRHRDGQAMESAMKAHIQLTIDLLQNELAGTSDTSPEACAEG